MTTDPIADFLNQFKNAGLAGLESFVVPNSKLKHEIAKILEKEGYLKNVSIKGKKIKKYLYCEIVYVGNSPKISNIKKMSKPSCRIYLKAIDVKPIKQGHGLAVISTSKGLMTDKEAISAKLGGEVLFNLS